MEKANVWLFVMYPQPTQRLGLGSTEPGRPASKLELKSRQYCFFICSEKTNAPLRNEKNHVDKQDFSYLLAKILLL